MKRYSLLILIIIISGIFVYRNQSKKQTYQKIAGVTQGTTYHITYRDNGKGNLKSEIDSLLHLFDLSLSTYDSTSVITAINQNKDFKTDKLFDELFKISKHVYDETNGYFDITVGPLVNAWGFGPSGKGISPDSSMIDSLMTLTGMSKLTLNNGVIKKTHPAVAIDVNAIAQGYSVDYISEYLRSEGIKHYMVEIGGELKVKGKNPKNTAWKIGIDKPIEGNMISGQNLQAIVQLENAALATSGNYRKFFEEDGMKVTHSINPYTGYPVSSNLLSTTIITEDCIYADAYATACMVMGLENSINFISAQQDIEAYLIYSNKEGEYQIWQTDGMEELIYKNIAN